MNIERRYATQTLEVRQEGADSPKLRGYAALFNTMSVDLGGFREQIAPGAFDGFDARDVYALRDHDNGKILGRFPSTLRLEADDLGLAVEIEPPDTELGRETVELVRRGDLSQMSFAFTTRADSWETDGDGEPVRTLLDVDLHEVSIVTFPAYPDTAIAVRSMDKWAEELRGKWEREMDARRRLREARLRMLGSMEQI